MKNKLDEKIIIKRNIIAVPKLLEKTANEMINPPLRKKPYQLLQEYYRKVNKSLE